MRPWGAMSMRRVSNRSLIRSLPAGLLGMTLVANVVGTAGAADNFILGRVIQVLDPTGAEADRRLIVVARERHSDISGISNPTISGATLTIVARGGMSNSQQFTLESDGWTALATGGYRYGRTTNGTTPVKKLTLKQSPSGTALLKVMLDGDVGLEPLSIQPPNPGDEGGIALAVAGGDRYCVTFGGTAGGQETEDSVAAWKVVRAAAENGCPTPVCGNGAVEGNEQCDGGFSVMCFFGCTPTCTCSGCGDAACSYDLGVPCCNPTDFCANAPGIIDSCVHTVCSQLNDCGGIMQCENGGCCLPPSNVVCGVPGSYAIECCGEAVCDFNEGICCLPAGAACDGSVPCCSGNCNLGTCD